MRTAGALLLLFVLTFGVRYVYVFHVQHDYDKYPVSIDNWAAIAQSLAEGQGFAVRSNRTGEMEPVAYRPPIYPIFLSLVYRVTGVSERAGLITQCVLDGVTAVLIVLLGAAVFGRFAAGYLAGLFFCFYYPEWKVVIRLFGTPIYVTMITLTLLQLWRSVNRPVAREFLVAGILCGLTSLTRPTGALLLPVILAWLWLATPKVARVRLLALMALGFCVTMSPWVARNYAVFGEYVPFDTNGGGNLLIGALGLRIYVPESEYPPEVRAQVEGKSEFDKDRILRRVAVRRILADPWGHTERSAKRLVMFFFRLPDPETNWIPTAKSLVGGGAIYLLAFLGWWLAPPGKTRSFLGLLGLLTLYTGLLHAQIVAQARLFFPVLPCLTVMAGGAVTTLAVRIQRFRLRPRAA
jgi:4-amino-4-deoxy-L-arabinose transferase-like glycosyltransferase